MGRSMGAGATDLDDEIAELERRLSRKRAALAAKRIVPVPRGEALVCTRQQEGLWFEHQLDPDSTVYHIPVALRLHGALDDTALNRALHALVTRHEALRTRFVEHNGLPRQIIDPAPANQPVTIVDIPADTVDTWVNEQINHRLNLATGPVFRAALARITPDDHVLVLVAHHIVADGWSVGILTTELTQLYAAETGLTTSTQLPDLAVQPADHAAWQRTRLDDDEFARHLDHWRTTLADLPTLDFPTDRPRPAHPTGAGAWTGRPLPQNLTTAAHRYARDNRISSLAIHHAALLTVLHRYTGQTDLPIGSIFSGRTHTDIEALVGYFTNTVVLRTHANDNPTFTELVTRCHDTILDASTHQDIPFSLIVDTLQPERIPGRNPLFQISLTLQPASTANALALGALTANAIDTTTTNARFDIAIDIEETIDGRIELGVEYATELFDADRIDRFLDHFTTALTNGLAQPEQPIEKIEIMPTAEVHQVLHAWNDTTTGYHAEPLHHLVERVAEHTPNAIAVIDHDGTHHTYRDLNTTANKLAHRLRRHGINPGDHVGVCLPRSIHLVTTLLAIWKTAAAYIPLDPDLPPERLTAMLHDATPPVVVTTTTHTQTFPTTPTLDVTDTDGFTSDADPSVNAGSTFDAGCTLDDTAYVIYTSGSTGTPKGVAVPHRGLHNRIAWMRETYHLQASDRVLQKTPFGFDVSVWEFFWPLTTGATLVLAAPGGHRDPDYLHRLIVDEGITALHFVPTVLQTFLDATADRGSLGQVRRVFSSGEALPPDTAHRFLTTWPDIELHNLYGPTEASIEVTAWQCEPDSTTVPIGAPIANTRTYVLDNQLRPTPIGIPGELHIAGTGLAHGYHNRPGLTARSFLADPYGPPGHRMYATGDLACWRRDGAIEYLGRTDRQVKLRGQRVELGEIEHTIAQHPDVRQCTVQLYNGTQLVAYVTGHPDLNHLRRHLADRLPTYMVPTSLITLPELPLTPSGKLDTARLPEPAPTATEHVAPRTHTEQWLVDTWQNLLDLDTVSSTDNFFDLGGNSLLGTQLAARVRDQLKTELPPRELFANPVLHQLADHIDRSAATTSSTPIVPVPRGEALVCTRQQEGLWFEHQLDPDSAVYHIPVALRLHGALDDTALSRALHTLVTRHEALRTRFVEHDGLPRQIIDPPPANRPVPVVEISADTIDAWVTEQVARPFDLAAGPVFRTALARLAPDDHVLVLVAHHIVADGWSAEILTGELTRLYAVETGLTTEARLRHLAVQPADHATWQRLRLDDDELSRKLDNWCTALADLPTIEFPADRPRPAHPTGAGARVDRLLPRDLAAATYRYARDNEVSFLAIHHAALLTVLHRYTGQTDLPIGSVFSGRTHTDIEPLVGYFANTVVLRTTTDGNPTFTELIDRCHDTILDASTHQDIPFSLIVDTLQPERIPGRNPLFQICLTLQPAGMAGARAGEDLRLGAVDVEPIDIAGDYARFDLSFDVTEQADSGLSVSVEYSTELFDADRIDRLIDHFTAALADGIADPGTVGAHDVELMSPQERRQVLQEWSSPRRPVTARRAPGLLHHVLAGADPDAVAIRFRGPTTGQLTYRELDRRSNQLAHALAGAGVRPGEVVALLLDRGLDLLVAQLAVLKAGAAWMPLDPQHPGARLKFQVDDTKAALVLTRRDLSELAPAHPPHWCLDDPQRATAIAARPDTPPTIEVRPDDVAYLIYTSGSTGTPKGVLVSHRSAFGYCENAVALFAITPADRVPLVANPAFDMSVFESFATLLGGGTVVGAPLDVISDPDAFTTFLYEEQVTVAYLPPALLSHLDPQRLAGSALRALDIGSESLSAELVNRWSRPGLELHNSYGPTETTVVCTDHLFDAPLDGRPPIGSALAGHRTYVLDRSLRPAPIGVPGQLFIAGLGVAHGYLDRPSLTAERFLADPYGDRPGQRMYASGDLARWRSDGLLEYLGRIDRQVKLRGQRVELGEVEHVLAGHPAVRQCVVALHDDSRLVGYLVGSGAGDTAVDLDEVRGYLADRLPTYMVPTTLITLPELPLTPNGKLDTARLPEPTPTATEHIAPRTHTEQWLADTWQNLLGLDKVSATDNFFDLGGNSLLGTQLAARVRDQLKTELPPRELFANPVLHQLADHIDQTATTTSSTPILPVPRRGTLVCTRQQEGLWFEHQLDPDSAVYHIPAALRLHGALDHTALNRALHTLITRHEALRTRFVEHNGLPHQTIDPAPANRPAPVVDISADTIDTWVTEQISRPFDLEAGPVFRTALARIAPDDHVLVLVAHHIVADGWSVGILTTELTQLYAAETGLTAEARLPDLPVQPADHAAWQRARLDDEFTRHLDRWRTTLADLPTLDFPTDRPRPAHPTGAGAWTGRPLPHHLATAAHRYARDNQVSSLAIHHAALLTVLHRYTGQTDLPIGSVFSGRTHTSVEALVGYFANTVVLRATTDGDPTFTELVTRCHDTVLDATALQDIPFSLIVDNLQPERIPGRNPLFQISLTLQPATTADELSLGALTANPIDTTTGNARFDIAIAIEETPDGHLTIAAEYSTELFDADRIDRLLDHFTTALTNGLAQPEQPIEDIDILTDSERDHILYSLNPALSEDADGQVPWGPSSQVGTA
ncbi:amino acid adenylation domain-containing protein [Micromonospora profundi]|uniref:amino acid adenylation domain-containing protein n=1 Tax=Micromonospora profundi TaxID=1420889 RepID=UPI0036612A6C